MQTLPTDSTQPPFVEIQVKRGHRRRMGTEVRVMMSGATIDPKTAKLAKQWRGSSLSLGLLLDQVFAFAKKHKFKPVAPKK